MQVLAYLFCLRGLGHASPFFLGMLVAWLRKMVSQLSTRDHVYLTPLYFFVFSIFCLLFYVRLPISALSVEIQIGLTNYLVSRLRTMGLP